jgi:hypothetical protein
MSRLPMLQVWIATVGLSTGLTVVPRMATGSSQALTGKVSDAMGTANGDTISVKSVTAAPTWGALRRAVQSFNRRTR